MNPSEVQELAPLQELAKKRLGNEAGDGAAVLHFCLGFAVFLFCGIPHGAGTKCAE